jgi:hypothetical protein
MPSVLISARRGWAACAGHDDKGLPSTSLNLPAVCCSSPSGRQAVTRSIAQCLDGRRLILLVHTPHIGRCQGSVKAIATFMTCGIAGLPMSRELVSKASFLATLRYAPASFRRPAGM